MILVFVFICLSLLEYCHKIKIAPVTLSDAFMVSTARFRVRCYSLCMYRVDSASTAIAPFRSEPFREYTTEASIVKFYVAGAGCLGRVRLPGLCAPRFCACVQAPVRGTVIPVPEIQSRWQSPFEFASEEPEVPELLFTVGRG